MSKEEPKEKISKYPTASVGLPSAQTSSKEAYYPMNIEKAVLCLQIITLYIETHVMQVGA